MEKSIIGIVPDIVEMFQTSLGALSTFIEKGYAAYVLVVEQGGSRTEEERLSFKDQCKRVRISEVFFLDGFDYSGVTQHNADLINSFLQKIQPSIVIMPYWKSVNFARKILARCALIACRGIGTILMYAVDNEKDPNYTPTISVRVSPDAALIKRRYAKDRLHPDSCGLESEVRTEQEVFPSSGAVKGMEECAADPTDGDSGDALRIGHRGDQLGANKNNSVPLERQRSGQQDNSHIGSDNEEIISNDRNNRVRDEYATFEENKANHDTIPSEEIFLSHRMMLVNDEPGW